METKRPEVRIENVPNPLGYTVDAVHVYVDGELVGGGDFGGEPEDNCECRDYSWVRPLLRKLSERLGARLTETGEPPEVTLGIDG